MVDPCDEPPNRERRIKALIGRTPSFIKSKFMSVLGSSNDLINGISNRVRIYFTYLSKSALVLKLFFDKFRQHTHICMSW